VLIPRLYSPVISGRDFTEVLNTNHKSSKAFTAATKGAELFADAGACMLSPEVTEGPLCQYLSDWYERHWLTWKQMCAASRSERS
jgi:hypothetical protein